MQFYFVDWFFLLYLCGVKLKLIIMIIKWFKALKEASLKKQKEQEFAIRKNGCLNNMLHELETEQAIALFNEVSEMFNETIKHRLQKAEKEIEVIGKFQNKI